MWMDREAFTRIYENLLSNAARYARESIRIIREEAEGYYQKQKTVDQVAEIIQSRIRIYVNEG